MQLIARFVSSDLGPPISLIAFCTGPADAAAMTMPIAAVHEYDFITGWENKIGLTRQILAVEPESEAKPVRHPSHYHFRLRMGGADARPHVGDEANALDCCARLPENFWTPGYEGAPGGGKAEIAEELRRIAANAQRKRV
jgi:hypothetical protein